MGRHRKWPPTVYRHSSGLAYFRVNGQPVYLGKHGAPGMLERYRRAVLECESSGDRPPPRSAARGLTVSEVAARWELAAAREYPKTSREPMEIKRALGPVLELYGSMPAADFGPLSLKAVQQAMVRAKLSRGVINRRIVRIKTVWKWAESEQLIPPNSYGTLRTVRGLRKHTDGVPETKKRRPAPWEHVQAIVPFLRKAPAAMLQLQWYCGMRSCEVRAMRTCEIDRSDPTCWLYVPGRHKNDWRDDDWPRVIEIGPRAQAILGPWLNDANPDAPIFQGRRGKAYSDNSYPNAIRRACLKAGIEPFQPYGTRHYARMRIAREAGDDGARQVLGHKSINTTQRYGRLDVEAAKDIMRKIG